jgi:hypothetical protein
MAHTPGISCLEQYVECLDQGIALFVQATGDRTEPTMKTYEAQALAVPRNLLITKRCRLAAPNAQVKPRIPESAQVIEGGPNRPLCHLAKAEVAGSNPVVRSRGKHL